MATFVRVGRCDFTGENCCGWIGVIGLPTYEINYHGLVWLEMQMDRIFILQRAWEVDGKF